MKVNIPVRDVIYGLLLASLVVVGGHAWYHQKQEISELQQKVDYTLRFTQAFHFAQP